jgi:diketogulonate reductase-like aldo/keto reductase
MEALVAAGQVRVLGISNVNARQVDELAAFARVAPAYVQNRCYASKSWDRDVRAACERHGIAYQGFSLLTANRGVVAGEAVRAAAARHDATPAQVVLRFAQQLGMIPLTGTRDPAHMRDDLALAAFMLAPDELARIEAAR